MYDSYHDVWLPKQTPHDTSSFVTVSKDSLSIIAAIMRPLVELVRLQACNRKTPIKCHVVTANLF